MLKKVSVIIPTYKRGEYLQRAVDSVLNQSYSNIEVIVVDDNDPNSQDRYFTEEKLLEYLSDNRVMYIKNSKNMGGALARNEGIKNARGDYITFLDDDDIYLPDKVRTQIEYMLENNLDMSFTDVRIHDINNKLVDYREHSYIEDYSKESLLKYHIMHHLTPTGTYMYKKKSLDFIGGFDDVRVGQEFMLMLKSIEQELKIGYIPIADVIQYLHEGERISIGENKLQHETKLYEFKTKYFLLMNKNEKKYVKFRHYAVMSVVGFRSKSLVVAVNNLFKAILTSPLYCFKELYNHIIKIKTKK